jgi:hypothetical protein
VFSLTVAVAVLGRLFLLTPRDRRLQSGLIAACLVALVSVVVETVSEMTDERDTSARYEMAVSGHSHKEPGQPATLPAAGRLVSVDSPAVSVDSKTR